MGPLVERIGWDSVVEVKSASFTSEEVSGLQYFVVGPFEGIGVLRGLEWMFAPSVSGIMVLGASLSRSDAASEANYLDGEFLVDRSNVVWELGTNLFQFFVNSAFAQTARFGGERWRGLGSWHVVCAIKNPTSTNETFSLVSVRWERFWLLDAKTS